MVDMKIIVDAFGGDHAPTQIIKGCAMAAESLGIEVALSGHKAQILKAAEAAQVIQTVRNMEIFHCADRLSMEDEPASILNEKSESSMAVGLRALADGKGDAFASAGNSGALAVGATMIVKRIPGIKRVTFAPVIPSTKGFFMLSDGGANVDCRPSMLTQFAVMATVYMEHVMQIRNPRVGLVNVGTEAHKGDALRTESYQLMKNMPKINFIGNIEGRDIPYGGADIVITDGFNGNVLLKVYEGLASAMMDMIKDVFSKNMKTKLAAAMVLNDMKALKKSFDYNEHGGAPIMGAVKPVFKIHGSAKAETVKNALRLTRDYAASGITDIIAKSVAK